MGAQLPQPVYPGVPPVLWGSGSSSAPTDRLPPTATLRQLVAWGDAAPVPLQLTPVERISLAFYGGYLAFGGQVASMFEATKRSDGRWQSGGLSAPSLPTCWASDPRLVISVAKFSPGSYVPEVANVGWASIAYPAGLDENQGDGVATAPNLFGWGEGAAPAQVLSAVEIAALRQSGDDAGWLKVRGAHGTGLINLLDPRFAKSSVGTWLNRNDPTNDLGLAVSPASKPKNGVAGFIDAVTADVEHDPLGAILFVIVAVSAGPALMIALSGLASVAAVGAVVGVATGNTQAVKDVAQAVVSAAEHPAEIGRVVGGLELAAAGAVVGIKGLGALGGTLTGTGLANAFAGDGTSGPAPSGGPASGNAPGANGARRWWQILGGQRA